MNVGCVLLQGLGESHDGIHRNEGTYQRRMEWHRVPQAEHRKRRAGKPEPSKNRIRRFDRFGSRLSTRPFPHGLTSSGAGRIRTDCGKCPPRRAGARGTRAGRQSAETLNPEIRTKHLIEADPVGFELARHQDRNGWACENQTGLGSNPVDGARRAG